jgi:hypothetical protein
MWIGSGTDLWVDSISAGLNGRSLWLEEARVVRLDGVINLLDFPTIIPTS